MISPLQTAMAVVTKPLVQANWTMRSQHYQGVCLQRPDPPAVFCSGGVHQSRNREFLQLLQLRVAR